MTNKKNEKNTMNKDLKDLIINCEKEMRNHNPTPLKVCTILKHLIEEKTICNIFQLKDLIEDNPNYLLRYPNFGRTSLRYLKEKMYSMFKFTTIVQVQRII